MLRVSMTGPEGWQGWDAYAPFYDWENQRTIGARDVPFWQQFAADRPGRVLELGCGTGRLSLPLARSATELVGVDRSAAMLARARTRSRRARLHGRLHLVRADIRSLPFPARSFRVVIAPYGILQSLLNDDDLVAVLASVSRVLTPRGVFGIDVVSDLPRWPDNQNRRQLSGSKSPGVHLTLVESVRQQKAARVTIFEQRYTTRGRRGAAEHRFELRFRTPSMRRLTGLLKQAGLPVASLFGTTPAAPGIRTPTRRSSSRGERSTRRPSSSIDAGSKDPALHYSVDRERHVAPDGGAAGRDVDAEQVQAGRQAAHRHVERHVRTACLGEQRVANVDAWS